MIQQSKSGGKVEETTSNSDHRNEDIVNIAEYKGTEKSESAAFAAVMSQMNIADRNTFDKQFLKSWNESSEKNELLSVLVCEIDFFKEYLDNYGQQGASFMLLVVGLALKTKCEQLGYFLAHYEKEEFAILIKGGTDKNALDIAEDLRQSVESSRTEHKYSRVADFVTLSIGIASVYPTSTHMLMKDTNNALNEAKTFGRNQISVHFPKVDKNREKEAKQVAKESEPVKENTPKIAFADRASFESNFVRLWKESLHENELLSMLICELDSFQPYAANYGKQDCEEMFFQIKSILLDICNEFRCFSAHIENERFIVLLKGGNATKPFKVAQKLHQTVEQSQIKHEHSDVKDIVTMSIGLSSIFPSNSNSMQTIMAEANTALNTAIASGKNQIGVF